MGLRLVDVHFVRKALLALGIAESRGRAERDIREIGEGTYLDRFEREANETPPESLAYLNPIRPGRSFVKRGFCPGGQSGARRSRSRRPELRGTVDPRRQARCARGVPPQCNFSFGISADAIRGLEAAHRALRGPEEWAA